MKIFCHQDVSNFLSTVQEDNVENNVPRESYISASSSMVPGGNFFVEEKTIFPEAL